MTASSPVGHEVLSLDAIRFEPPEALARARGKDTSEGCSNRLKKLKIHA
jgi:hypothetical protein